MLVLVQALGLARVRPSARFFELGGPQQTQSHALSGVASTTTCERDPSTF